MPMLAITTIIATNIFQEDKDTENRVEEDSDSDTDDTDDGDDTGMYGFDGWFMQPNLNSFKHRRNSGDKKVVSYYSVTVE